MNQIKKTFFKSNEKFLAPRNAKLYKGFFQYFKIPEVTFLSYRGSKFKPTQDLDLKIEQHKTVMVNTRSLNKKENLISNFIANFTQIAYYPISISLS